MNTETTMRELRSISSKVAGKIYHTREKINLYLICTDVADKLEELQSKINLLKENNSKVENIIEIEKRHDTSVKNL